MSRFTKALAVTPLADGKTWVLIHDFAYEEDEIGSGKFIEVDIGFMTDFASVPRPLWWIFPRWGKYGNAAVLHDWLYWKQDRDKSAADTIFLQAMTVLEVPWWQKYPIYWAVSLFGKASWLRNQWDRKAGFIRVKPVEEFEVFKSTQRSERLGLIHRLAKHVTGKGRDVK